MNIFKKITQKLKNGIAYNRGDGYVYFDPGPENANEPSPLPSVFEPHPLNDNEMKKK